MKIKGLISVILTAFLAFASFSVTVAEENVSSPDEATVTVAMECRALTESLGIDIRLVDIAQDVTRAEFVYALMQSVRNNGVYGGLLPFADVAGDSYYASAVGYALDMGIISSSSVFSPDEPVTIAQISKMTVCALGRNVEAELRGGWPYGYISVAHDAELFPGIDTSDSEAVISGYDLYVIISEFLKAPMYEIDGMKSDMISYTGKRNALEIFYDITEVEGVITATEYTSLYDADAVSSEGQIEIDEACYIYSGMADIGSYVTAYVKKASYGMYEIVYLDSSETNIYLINCDSIDAVDERKIEYYTDNNKLDKISFTQYPAIIYNGKAMPGFKLSALVDLDGRIEAVDNNDNGVCDVIRVFEAKTMYVDSVSAIGEILIDKNEGILNLGANSDISYTVLKNGMNAELSDITAGTVITYYESDDLLLYTIIADTKSVKGTVSEVDNGNKTFYIDSVPYEYTEYFEKFYLNNVTIGTEANFLLSDTGKIVAVAKVNSSEMQYGYFIAVAKGKGLDTDLKIKMFAQNGKVNIYHANEKTSLNAQKVSDVSKIYNHLIGTDGIQKPQLVRFAANADGYITELDTVMDENKTIKTGFLTGDENNYDNLVRFDFPDDVYRTIHFRTSTSTVHPYFRVTDQTPVFLISHNESLDDSRRYTVKTKSYLTSNTQIKLKDVASNLDDETYQMKVYNVTAYGDAGAILIFTGSAGASSVSANSPCGIVASVSRAIAPDGSDGLKVVLLKADKYTSYYLTDEYVLRDMDTTVQQNLKSKIGDSAVDSSAPTFTNPKIQNGDYLRVEADDEGMITAIAKDYDFKNRIVLKTFGNHSYECEYYYGKIYAKSGDILSMVPENISSLTPGDISDNPFRFTFIVSGTVTTFDSNTQKAEVSTSDEIMSYLIAGDNCHEILARTDEGKIADIVIFK